MRCIKGFYLRRWSAAEKVLLTVTMFLAGAVIGFAAAPVKKGVYCGNHNGNSYPAPEAAGGEEA